MLTVAASAASASGRSLRDAEVWQELWAQATAGLRVVFDTLLANFNWLSRAWLDGLGTYERAAATDNDNEEEEQGWTRSNGDQTSGSDYFRTESMFSLQTKRV